MMLKDKGQSSKFNVQRAKCKEEKRRDSQRASALLVCLTKKSFQMKGNLTVTFVILD